LGIPRKLKFVLPGIGGGAKLLLLLGNIGCKLGRGGALPFGILAMGVIATLLPPDDNGGKGIFAAGHNPFLGNIVLFPVGRPAIRLLVAGSSGGFISILLTLMPPLPID
jgi:hypothetical protein